VNGKGVNSGDRVHPLSIVLGVLLSHVDTPCKQAEESVNEALYYKDKYGIIYLSESAIRQPEKTVCKRAFLLCGIFNFPVIIEGEN
jgi:hypothetical protein